MYGHHTFNNCYGVFNGYNTTPGPCRYKERWRQHHHYYSPCQFPAMPNTEELPIQALEEPEFVSGSGGLPGFNETFYPSPLDMSMNNPAKVNFEGLKTTQTDDCTDMNLSSLDFPDSKNFTNLTPVKELFRKFEKPEDDLDSWTKTHPHEWTNKQVLDFIYSLVEVTNGPTGLRGENFQGITGRKLSDMTCHQLKQLEPQYGQTIYDQLQQLLKKADFSAPNALETTDSMDFHGTTSPLDLSNVNPQTSLLSSLYTGEVEDSYPGCLMPELEDNKAHIFFNAPGFPTPASPLPTPATFGQSQPTDGTFVYDFDVSDKFDDHQEDSGYTSSAGSSTSSQIDLPDGVPTLVLQPEFQNDPLDSTPCTSLPGFKNSFKKVADCGGVTKRRPGRPKRERIPSNTSSDGETPAPKQRGRKPGQMSKGNHLWEFIRDLLKDPNNSDIIKWEDKNDGVFRILKSSEVSHRWGQKKSNPNMNYEKLSRAMRHYYKNGIMVAVLGRRLVYRFGNKATGWRNSTES